MPFKECFIHDNECVQAFSQAHILSQSATMKLVHGSTKGGLQVVHLGNVDKNGEYKPKSIGWSMASAHHCFCKDHDNKLFTPIENDNKLDTRNKEQLFLHVMRSFAYVYYRKKQSTQLHQNIISDFNSIGDSLDRLRNYFAQFIVLPPKQMSKDEELRKNISLNLWSFQYVRNELIKIQKTKEYDRLEYRCLTISEKLPFASAGVLFAQIIDPNRKILSYSINPGDPVIKPPAIMFNVLPDKFGRTIIIVAVLKDDGNALQLLHKFDRLDGVCFFQALTRLVFDANKDNTFLHPKFWKHLEDKGYSSKIITELNEGRGFDVMGDPLKLSNINLFSKEFYCTSLGID
jgi:hypothetical protein